MLMHPQELNPYKPPDNAKKGVECTPLKLPKFYISAVSAVVEPHPRSITNTQYIITFCPAFDRLAISLALKDGLVEVITFFNCQLHNIPPYIQYFPSYPGKSKPGNRTPETPTLLIIYLLKFPLLINPSKDHHRVYQATFQLLLCFRLTIQP